MEKQGHWKGNEEELGVESRLNSRMPLKQRNILRSLAGTVPRRQLFFYVTPPVMQV